MRNGPGGTDRAVSVTVGYVMTLAISTLLLSGLFVAGGSFVETQRERAAQGELTVVGERIAADLGTVDRLVASAESPENLTANRSVTLPNRVAGTGYRVRVSANGTEGTIALESEQTDATVEVPFRTRKNVTVANATVDGGDLRIWWDRDADGGDGAVVVRGR
ncbi:hypothetical protein C463_07327 [Halorubrum californiense DSM 19288]|uniref:Flagellin n=1 Tax=Halorubrum californiense DSM 19288 TaxID=1227465 RepID=M0ECH1_9EURY|nr:MULTISPECIES: hypothetical protein [Halorubrum]ELZ44748.1 hypothetical protein C463_07327 [Halorubrum californiense DSM 19288]TKX71785.1 hypothetical protein EXE40_06870 [Halorubrum sp. GN11GM_10-3_MGM]